MLKRTGLFAACGGGGKQREKRKGVKGGLKGVAVVDGHEPAASVVWSGCVKWMHGWMDAILKTASQQ